MLDRRSGPQADSKLLSSQRDPDFFREAIRLFLRDLHLDEVLDPSGRVYRQGYLEKAQAYGLEEVACAGLKDPLQISGCGILRRHCVTAESNGTPTRREWEAEPDKSGGKLLSPGELGAWSCSKAVKPGAPSALRDKGWELPFRCARRGALTATR